MCSLKGLHLNMRSARQAVVTSRASIESVFASGPLISLLTPILWLAYTLRVFGLGNSDLWLDEGITAFVSGKPVLEILLYCSTRLQSHPPGYYIALHFWRLLVGDSEFALRLLAAAGGVLTVTMLAVLTRRWFGRGCAVLVALLMAVQPMAAQYGREARMYSWLMAIALLNVYLLDRAIGKNRWRDWGWFLATALVALTLHYLAALFLLAYGLFLVVRWRQLSECRWRFAGVLAILILPPLLWIALMPGPRTSLLQLAGTRQGEVWTLARLEPVYTRWALGGAADTMRLPRSLALASFAWLLALIGVVAMPPPRSRSRGELQWLLGLLIVVPPIVGSMIFTVTIARQYLAMLGIFVMATALGILALFRWARVVGTAALVAVLGLSIWLGSANMFSHYRPFSPAINYIIDRARVTEPLVYTHYLEWALNDYYNSLDMPVRYVPPGEATLTRDQANREAADLIGRNPSLWLMLFPGLVNTERMESALNNQAFPSEKVWFAGGRGVVHYFAPVGMREQPGDVSWDEQIRLNRWWVSDAKVAAGDALRLQFEWQGLRQMTEQAIIALRLVGSDGTTWAERIGEPCNDHCPTTEWHGETVTDRQALYVPSDVPPGDYTLRLAWLTPAGQPLMGHSAGAAVPQVDLALMQVNVGPPPEPQPNSPSPGKPTDATLAPGLRLRGVEFKDPTMVGGDLLTIPTQWEVTSAQPALDVRLVLSRDTQQVSVSKPLGPAWYPSTEWTAGHIVRDEPQFLIPGGVLPGTYRVSLGVAKSGAQQVDKRLEIGKLTIRDRPRSFDLPADGAAVGAQWQEGIRLARIVLPREAKAGNAVSISPIWQAGGPTAANWKVFIHVLDGEGNIWAQGDGYPDSGRAPTPTWQKDEVVVDAHELSLPDTLPEGEYSLRIGFYDERSGQRLPLTNGSDSFTLPPSLRVVE
jgi:hypothetical protein